MGIILPNMGKVAAARHRITEATARYAGANLSDALFTRTQQRVLACLFGEPDRSYTVSELIKTTGAGSGAVQRELARLAGSGLLNVEQVGNQRRYHANPVSPIHGELISIVRKTFGLAGPLREALQPIADRITAAFVYGSMAKRSDSASSDIDLFIVSDTLGYADAMATLHPWMEQLGRDINPTIYSRDELRRKLDQGNSFLTRVLEQPKLWLLGGEDDLGA